MRRKKFDAQAQDIQADHFLRRAAAPWGVGLSEEDYMRGHKDDFFGDLLRDEYETQFNGGGAFALRPIHGGVFRLRCNAGSGNWRRLWLGDQAQTYPTLDADHGWVQLARFALTDVTDVFAYFGAWDNANDHIMAGFNSVTGANWILVTDDGTGPTTVDSGVAAVAGCQCWHALDVYPTDDPVGHQVDYWLDKRIIATTTVDIPATTITPFFYLYNLSAVATRNLLLDYWAVIPRNLT